jgi:tetratricopeptide (TPR) repeat protein
MAWSDSEEIYARLDRLGEYRTISAFGLAYYEAIADYLSGEGRSAQGLRLRFAEFLEVMERYHRALEVFTVEDQVTMGNVRSAAERRDIGLEALLEQLAVDETRGDAEIGRLLLSAECYYQLALVERVVAKLEAAVEAGAVHPLAQFALGYNRFDLAMRAFTRYDGDAGERVVDDEDRFRLACLSAVAAMQDGLSGSSFDCELHWWIGHILQAAGFDETARASFDKAEELAHAMGLQQETEDAALALGLEIESDYEYDPISESGPISEDEVRQAGQLLRLSYTQSEIMDD